MRVNKQVNEAGGWGYPEVYVVGDDELKLASRGPGWSSMLEDELRWLLFMNSLSHAL